MRNRMSDKGREECLGEDREGEIEYYGDPQIATYDAKVPAVLKWSYLFWPIWGIVTFYYFWNGSMSGEGGYWQALQVAANTTFPIQSESVEK